MYLVFPRLKGFLYLFFLLVSGDAIGQTYVFAKLSGTPINTTGWNLQGGAYVGNITGTNNGEMILCPLTSASGAVFYNQPINLSLCNKWKAEFDFRMHDGSGADGIAFCFLDVPPVGFVTGGGLGIPQSANGLKVCFDTWNNCIPFVASHVHDSMPKIEIRYGIGYNECTPQPTFSNSAGALDFITSALYHHAMVQYNNGNIGVYVDGQLYLTGYQQFNFAGYLGFTASTGGYHDNHSIKNVIIYTEMPPSVAGPSVSFCPNGNAQLGTVPNSTYQYAWTSGVGLSATDIANPTVHLDNKGPGLLLQKYYVRTSFANNPGCSSVDSVTVVVNPGPRIGFRTPAICLKDASAQFFDSSYTGDPTGSPLRYRWDFGDLNATAGNPDTSSKSNPIHSYSAARNYNVQLRVTTANGCQDSLLKVFTVNGAFPKSDFTILNSSLICSSKEVKIQNISTVDFGNITRTEIWWDYGNFPGNLFIDSLPAPNKVYSHQYTLFFGSSPRKIQIKMRAYSGQLCADEIQKEIVIYPLPSVIFNSVNPVCEDIAPFPITAAYDSARNIGRGYFLGPGIDSAGLFNPRLARGGDHLLTYVFTTSEGCSDSAKSSITVWSLPRVNAGKELFVLEGGSAILPATASGTGLVYRWSPAQFLNSNSILQPRSTPLSDITYTLTVMGTGGCVANDTLFVKVLKRPLIPNAFSPNGDGINDKWEIKYLDAYPDCTVDVYNRYGQPIFHSTGYTTPWNGTFQGAPLPVGVYYYIINPKNGRSPLSGSLTLLR